MIDRFTICGLILLAAVAKATPAFADPVEDFYRNRQVRIIIGNAVGADYDLGGRLLARHMSRHLAGGPAFVVQNMPGAASINAANYIYNVAPKDGSLFGSISRNLPGQAIIGRDALKADPRKFEWIGSSGTNTVVCYVRRNSPVTKAQDLFSRELVVGGIGSGSTQTSVPTALNRLLGMRFKVVEGYKGNADALIALERSEIDGLCSGYSPLLTTHAALLKEGRVRLILHSRSSALEGHPDVPSFLDLAKSEKSKLILRFLFSSDEFGRPYFAPPGTPRERLAALRDAFKATLNEPALQADASKMLLDMTYRSPEALEAYVKELAATPPEVVKEIQEIAP
jgi:tripartite-type tricarboxylate transporter receptor subunit TctC